MKRLCILVLFGLFFGVVQAQPPATYFVSDFTSGEFENMLDLCQRAGIKGLLQEIPFSSYGHYLWNPDFAPEGDRSVASMVKRSQECGVQMGIFAQSNAISLNDTYFSPRYYHRLKKSGRVALFDDIAADQREFALYPNEVFDRPSTLNLLLVDGEMISYGTMEPARDAILLYRCTRGAYGTMASDHGARVEAYKIWDSPGRFVAPDESLRDSVQWYLAQRIAAAGLRFVRYSGESGMNRVDGSVRVRQVEAWEQEEDSRRPLSSQLDPMSLGWFSIHASDGRQPATTVEELEWFLAKAAAFDAGYGLVIDRAAIQRLGMLDRMLALVKAWNSVREAGVLSDRQKEDLKDPYADWHLEPYGEDSFLLYPVWISRRYRCAVAKGPILENWRWKSDTESSVALCVEVKGKGEIRQPTITLGADTLCFPCMVKAGQQMVCGFNGVVRITDADFHVVKEMKVDGIPTLPEGETEVTFSCETRSDGKSPEVSVRYQIREAPMPLSLNQESYPPY